MKNRMKLHEIINKLKDNGFTLVKNYGNREVWEKNGKQLTLPMSDEISPIIVRRIMDQVTHF